MSRRPMSRRASIDGGQAGFTLVETLVCLALAGLIGVLLLNAVRIAGGASAAASRASAAEEVQSVRDHLRRTLGSLAQRRRDGSRPTLAGGPDGLVAVLAPDRTLERPTERAAALSLVPGRRAASTCRRPGASGRPPARRSARSSWGGSPGSASATTARPPTAPGRSGCRPGRGPTGRRSSSRSRSPSPPGTAAAGRRS